MNKKKVLAAALALGMAMTTISSTAMTAFAEEAEGVELTVGVSTMAQNISPFTNFTNRQPIQQYLYENLLYRDSDGVTHGVIAKDWTTEDNITYDIEIYDYVYDTAGNQIKAEDVVYSLEHARDEAANTWIVSAEETGDYTLTVTLTDDTASTFNTAFNRAPIVSIASYEASEDGMAASVVSTSPYMVTEFTANVSVTLERNPNYWQTDESLQNPLYSESTVQKLNYVKISEASQQSIALETGSVNAFRELSSTEISNFLEGGRDEEGYTALGYESNISYIFYFANQGLCGEDVNLRAAISYAIDKSAVVLGAFSGQAAVPTFMGSSISDLVPSSASEDYFAYDAELAQEYLANSSYNGETLRLLIPNEDNHSRIAAIVQGYLMAIGINVEIDTYDNAMFQTNFGDGSTWDIAICQMGMADVAFVWEFLSWDLSGGDAGAMGMAVQDEALDELLTTVLSQEGHNVENATLVSDYINENFYGENLVCGMNYYVFDDDLGAVEVPVIDIEIGQEIACTVFE
ncbi:MAG: ABC transporter substrate-binding protein [Lachnospiraceae bacterium]|nr:ABC transporter substrate-binding protein [Lachnospiraceae bacterium]